MKVINLSIRKFSQLLCLDIPNYVRNTEGKILEFEHKGEKKVIKKLFNDSGELFASKLYTIETLNNNKEYLPRSFVIPDSLVSVNSNVVGFTVPFTEGINLEEALHHSHLDLNEQKYYLKKIGETLEQLSAIRKYTPLKSVFINDLQESNVLVDLNNRSISIIDLDSSKIGTNSSFPSRYMLSTSLLSKATSDKYIKNEPHFSGEGEYTANAESDLYCYIIIIMNYLLGSDVSRMKEEDFYSYLGYLSTVGVDKNLLDCFDKILRFEKNTNPCHFIDSLTYKQVGLARENVYKLKRTKNG